MAERNACTQELWRKYSKDKSTSNKNELVLYYLPAVKKAVLRLLPSYNAYCTYDDMVSSGVIGLMDAIEKYDATRDTQFETYSAMRIRGEILDSIRAQDWASDSLRRRIKAAARARGKLQETLGREPDSREIAACMNISEAALLKALEKSRTFNVVYLEDMAQQDDAWEQHVPGESSTPEEIAENNVLAETLGVLIDRLADRERLIISLYYYEELTQKEIAHMLGVTEARVCQMRAGAVAKIKAGLQRTWTAD